MFVGVEGKGKPLVPRIRNDVERNRKPKTKSKSLSSLPPIKNKKLFVKQENDSPNKSKSTVKLSTIATSPQSILEIAYQD